MLMVPMLMVPMLMVPMLMVPMLMVPNLAVPKLEVPILFRSWNFPKCLCCLTLIVFIIVVGGRRCQDPLELFPRSVVLLASGIQAT
jgi:hypothetical protein